jgi:hypothetical protein
MDNLDQLKLHSSELLMAIEKLSNCSANGKPHQDSDQQSLIDPEALKARADIVAIATKIRTLVCGPTEFLQHLASQVCTALMMVVSRG